MRPKKDLLRWLRILTSDDAYMSTVLRYGDWFFGRANVAEYEAAELWKSRRRPRAGHCFYNAQTYCIDHREATYWEGYFLIRGLPIHHGWVVMEDGRVVDFTIEAVIRKLIRERKPVDETIPLYLGINVPRPYIKERLRTGPSGKPLGQQFVDDHPNLKRRRSW